MLSFVLMLLLGSPAPAARPWRIYVNPSESKAMRNPTDQAEACAAAHLQDQGGASVSTPIRSSLINRNWRAVSFEARGRQAGEEEDTIRYSMCLKGEESYPLVSITSTARASAFNSHRDEIARISESVRFRPAV